MPNKSIKVVCLSDTHTATPNVPKGDILLHAGDATWRGTEAEVCGFAEWFGSLPHKYKIFVAGNHDFLFEENPRIARAILKHHNIIYLEDEMVTINGLKIYGSPWQPEFNNWAFNLPRGEMLRKKWQMIPDKVDILITHSPPFGILDEVPDANSAFLMNIGMLSGLPKKDFPVTKINVGCEELIKRVKEVKPELHIFGHIHESYGSFRFFHESGDLEAKSTDFKNVSICNERYRPINKPQRFTFSGGK